MQPGCSSVVLVSSSAFSAATLPTCSSPGGTTVGSPRATTEVTDGHQEDEQQESPPGVTLSNSSVHAYNNILFAYKFVM